MALFTIYFYDIKNESRLLMNGVVTAVNKLEVALSSLASNSRSEFDAKSVEEPTIWSVTSSKTDSIIEVAAPLVVDTIRILRGWVMRSCSLIDIAVLDFPSHVLRFTVSYVFGAIATGERFIIRTATSALQPLVSIVGYFPNANWVEREVSEMYGLIIIGHPNTSKLLCDYRGGDANQRKGSGANTCEEYSRDELTAELMHFAMGFTFLSVNVSSLSF